MSKLTEALDSIMNLDKEKEESIQRLERLGFHINKRCFDGEVYMSRKRGGTTILATVQANGNINGESADKYMSWVKNYK